MAKRKASPAQAEVEELPPWEPTDLEQLREAVMLLGNRAKGPLTPRVAAKLEALIGACPADEATARRWKDALKPASKDAIFKCDPESGKDAASGTVG